MSSTKLTEEPEAMLPGLGGTYVPGRSSSTPHKEHHSSAEDESTLPPWAESRWADEIVKQ